MHVNAPLTSNKKHHQHTGCVPEVFSKTYNKIITHDVSVREAVCLTYDVAVLGDAAVEGGDTCITGNLLIAGSVTAKGSICVTGDVIVLGPSAHLEGDVCVTGDVFVKGDLAVKGKLKVGGKLCVFGSKDIQPAA